MTFKGGREEIKTYDRLEIKDNWLYASTSYADANNPNWRLPLTTEKAFKSKKATSGASSSSSASYSASSSESKKGQKKSSGKQDVSEKELQALETVMYGYNEAAWRAKRRADGY